MTKLGPYEVHPFADEFRLLEGIEFDELVASIKEHGLRDPITLTHDKTVLVDGRNRYRACEAAGVEPNFDWLGSRYTEPMILDFIVDKNVRHRHMSKEERQFTALRYEELSARAIAEAERRRKSTSLRDGESQSITERFATSPDLAKSKDERSAAARAAEMMGVSRTAVQQAKAIRRDAPDLEPKVRAGEMSTDAAYRQARERVREQPKPDPKPKPSPVMLTLLTHTGEEVKYPKPAAKPTFNESKGDGISWAAWSWNPATGCLHGCGYCYARAIAARFSEAYPAGFTPLFHEERLDAPANTVIPERYRDEMHEECGDETCEVCAYRRVFVCSMADLYGRWVPQEWIDRVHSAMLGSPQWQYLLLTKFPDRYVGLDLPESAWVGTSVDEQKRVRIAERAFSQIDGVKVKWLSLEPLREPLEFSDLSMFDWVVIGAQTETRQPDGVVPAFQPEYEWVDRIYHQAIEAGCRVHFKPNLTNGKPGMRMPSTYPLGRR